MCSLRLMLKIWYSAMPFRSSRWFCVKGKIPVHTDLPQLIHLVYVHTDVFYAQDMVEADRSPKNKL